jgi:hypothetical protein
MQRRDFLRCLGVGLGAGFLLRHFPGPARIEAAGQDPLLPASIALLADAHLKDGNPARPEALALARAVAEIQELKPAPLLALFAGDLAHQGDPRALALGREILSELPAPLLAVMGEGDGLPEGAGPWRRLFGNPWFSNIYPDFQVLGVHTAWCPGPGGPVFQLGEAGRRCLAQELGRLEPDKPLIILSHAPLTRIYQPWQQWTADAGGLEQLLQPFRQVICLHGHVHRSGARGQGPGGREPALLHRGLLATAWPLPSPLQGTPSRLTPKVDNIGCGWGMVRVADRNWHFGAECRWA